VNAGRAPRGRPLAGTFALLRRTVERAVAADVATQGAALTFYTLISLAPMLVIGLAIVGRLLGVDAARAGIETQFRLLMGPHASSIVHELLQRASPDAISATAGALGIATLFIGAASVFNQMQTSLNLLWEVKPRPHTLVLAMLRRRLLSFGLVLAMGFLLVVSLLLSTAITGVSTRFVRWLGIGEWSLTLADAGLFFVAVGLLLLLLFRFLPDADLRLRDVAPGAFATAFAFSVGKLLIDRYLGAADFASTYGVAGSLVVFLLWVYYSSMIVLVGAAFTRAWHERATRAKPAPAAGAERARGVAPTAA